MSLIVIDTSVWARLRQSAVAEAVVEAIESNAVAMPTSVLLELLRSARNADELRALSEEYSELHQIQLTAEVEQRALVVQASLSKKGYHRALSPVDLLTAAAAESVGAELWHCDRDFELVAEATGQRARRLGR
jgi:predicted nucleic acid-binding protein